MKRPSPAADVEPPPPLRPWTRPDVRRDVELPVRRQIVARLAASLRAGDHPPAERLPGARTLAVELGVHRHTVRAAYLELARMGLVEVRPGSGVYPRPRAGANGGAPTANGGRPLRFRGYLAAERAAGHTATEIDGWLTRWSAAVRARRVLVLGPNPRRRALWARELALDLKGAGVEVLDGPVESVTRLTCPAPARPGLLAAPTGLVERVLREAPGWAEVFPLHPGPAARVRRLLHRLPDGSVLAVITRCRSLAREVTELAASLRGDRVGVTRVLPDDADRLARMARVARFVLADVQGVPAAAAHVPPARLLTLRDLDPVTAEELRAYLRVGDASAGDSERKPCVRSVEG